MEHSERMPQLEMLEGSMMSARMAMAISDPHQADNPIVFANPAFMEMTGYESAEVIGRNCRFLQGPDTSPSQLSILRHALDERRAVEIDLLNYRRNGQAFHNRLFVSPVLDHHGELVHFFASQLDVTPQKRFESLTRRREDVLRAVGNEFHARVQTTIDNVQSMVEGALQSASSPMAAAADISEKLVALGHVHKSLIKSDWDNLEIRDIVTSALRTASQTSNRMQLSGPSLKLSPRLAFQVAAFVRDLFIQSMSEGALQDKHGHVCIEWSRSTQGASDELVLVWRDYVAERVANVRSKRAFHSILHNGGAAATIGYNADEGCMRYVGTFRLDPHDSELA